jgi:hypothetical protein
VPILSGVTGEPMVVVFPTWSSCTGGVGQHLVFLDGR